MPPYRNLLLSRLFPADLQHLERHFEPIVLPLRSVQIYPLGQIDYVTFLESGLGSEIAMRDGHDAIEIGIIGREGLIGMPAVLGQATSPHKTFMQIAGHGVRISAPALKHAMNERASLREPLMRYVHEFMLQLAETAHANGRFKIQARLARWLLMSDDRIDGAPVPLTHEFLGLMLGVRRAGVSEALAALEGEGLVRAAKSNITIINREGLKAIADPIYTANAELHSG